MQTIFFYPSKEQREAQLEKIEDIERNKATLRKGLSGSNTADDDDANNSDNDEDTLNKNEAQHNEKELKTYQDEQTTHQFGGLVSVTTTFGIPSDDDDDDNDINTTNEFYERKQHGSNHIDEEQKLAGNVNNYMKSVKSTMGGKKKGGGGSKHKKGMHGAQSMKGMGNNIKFAKKTLSKFKTKGDEERGARGGGKAGKGHGKKRVGRRGGKVVRK